MGIELEQVRAEEKKLLKKKRAKSNPEDGFENPTNLFGIALSGGGIRSATINLGILEVFNKRGVLKLVDYLSTVSGGGYIGGYVHAKLKGCSNGAHDNLFSEGDINYLKNHGDYLIPGRGIQKTFNRFRFSGAFLFSVVMNWVWALSLLSLILCFLQGLFNFMPESKSFWNKLGYVILFSSTVTAGAHFFLHYFARIRLWSAGRLYFIEGIIFIAIMVYGLNFAIYAILPTAFLNAPWKWFLVSLATFLVTGFFADPNVITLHAFYRDSISETYLRTGTDDHRAMKLRDVVPDDKPAAFSAPYPLINCCLNVLGENDKYSGMKTNDYFLLSPLYCGSKLTKYVSTREGGFNDLMLSSAVAISGAAVNPSMGTRTNRILAFFMTLLNLRLGYWAPNPNPKPLPSFVPSFLKRCTWWPYYHVLEMLAKTGSTRHRISISDGGHIENLGVYELLRRRCRLIIAIDASADPDYNFSDLRNLVVRVRQELGLVITFRQAPETYIRPKASAGFSDSHFVVADISELPGKKKPEEEEYVGLLVYVKSSLRPQKKFHEMAGNKESSDSFHYKSFHPAFPHESTVDQFFDEDQWEAYYNLGKYMAADLLKINLRKEDDIKRKCPLHSRDDLCNMFNNIINGNDLMKHYIC